jgi:hypothetical protein
MIVEFPDDYRERRACPAASGDGAETPECVIIGFHEPPVSTIWADTLFSSGSVSRVVMLPSDATIEAGIVRECGEDSYADVEAFDLPHRLVLAGALRLAVNAMLLLTEFGCKRLGPTNASNYERLRRHVAVSRQRGHGLEQAERGLRLAPQVYGFSQDVVLYDRELPPDRETHGDGVPPRRPHWRRGHVKMHAYGPKRSLRKRIFIRPTLVNHHLIHGLEPAADVVYRIR